MHLQSPTVTHAIDNIILYYEEYLYNNQITVMTCCYTWFRFQKGDDEVLIHLDQVNCTGKEDALHLMSCANVAHNEHDCVHNEDVALKCSKRATLKFSHLQFSNYTER